MADENELVENRKRAYSFLVQKAKLTLWTPPIDSDKRLASVLDISMNSLLELKDGKANPSEGMVKRIKGFFKNFITEGEINAFFINPFK